MASSNPGNLAGAQVLSKERSLVLPELAEGRQVGN